MTDTLTVVVYAAKSTVDEKGSIPQQIEACKSYAATNGWHVDSVESDEAASAYSGNRGKGLETALNRAAEIAKTGKPAGILVWHSNRIARGSGDEHSKHLIEYLFLARKSKFELRSVSDDATFSNSILTFLMGEMAHQDSVAKSAVVKRAMADRRERGLHTGGRIFGYLRDDEKGLKPNPDQAPTVQRIFNLIAGGKSQAEVARILNQDGVKPLRGRQWQQGSISMLLQRRTYLGEIQDGEGGWREAAHAAIVDADVWDAANAKRETAAARRGRGGGPRPKAGHLLPGKVLRHRSCGWAMTPVSNDAKKDGTVTGVYECSGRKGGVCDGFRVSMESVDESIISYLAEVGIDAGESLRLIQEATDTTRQARKAALESARGEVGRVEAERARMWRMFKAGDLDAEDWRDFKAEHEGEKAAATATVERLEAQTAGEADPAAIVPAAADALAIVRASMAAGDSDAVRSALEALFDHFEIDRVENMPEQVLIASADDMRAARSALREQIAQVEAAAGKTVAQADAEYWAEQAALDNATDAAEPEPDAADPELDPDGLMILPVPSEAALASIIEDGEPVRLVDERGRAVFRRVPLAEPGLDPATNNNGFGTWSSAPRAKLRTRSASLARPLITITGRSGSIRDVIPSAERTRSSKTSPLPSSSPRSSSTRAGWRTSI